METDASRPVEAGIAGDGPYLRRARALLAARAELFLVTSTRSARLAGIAGPPQEGQEAHFRLPSRQLTLPLPRERSRRRARMMR
jgi:hypothetical protein